MSISSRIGVIYFYRLCYVIFICNYGNSKSKHSWWDLKSYGRKYIYGWNQICSIFKQKYSVIGKNQYSSRFELGSARKKIKHWAELFFDVKVIGTKTYRLPRTGKGKGSIMRHRMHHRCVIITLQSGYSILLH